MDMKEGGKAMTKMDAEMEAMTNTFTNTFISNC